MTERKFTPPTEFPAEYVTEDGRKATIVAYKEGWNYPYVGFVKGSAGWFTWDKEGQGDYCEYDLHDLLATLRIPWSLFKSEYRWAAMDADGSVFLYTEEPSQSDTFWDGKSDITYLPLEKKPNLSRWGETLTKRPEGV